MTGLYEQLQATLGTAYQLERELGGGGMSRVFLAHETALGRKVVVKVLLPELAAGVSVERFRREIQLAAQLQHPHIVTLLAAGESEGLPYFTMPFITGESLRVKLAREGELPVIEAVRILRDVVSGLAYAHRSGIMHRDVKPDNVLISGGVAVVTDFGVAKALSVSADVTSSEGLTSLGMALGTPAYMAPEQATGDPQVDHRADIYALGIMAYEMLTGRTPFAGRPAHAVLAAHAVEVPDPIERLRPAVPPILGALVMQCLAKRPADRPQSAAEVMHVLDAIGTPTGGTAHTTVVVAHVPTRPRSRTVGISAAVAAGAVLLAGGLLWRRNASRAAPTTAASVPAAATGVAAVADSGAIRPETARPEAARPEAARPEAARPEVTRPSAAAPSPKPIPPDTAPAQSAQPKARRIAPAKEPGPAKEPTAAPTQPRPVPEPAPAVAAAPPPSPAPAAPAPAPAPVPAPTPAPTPAAESAVAPPKVPAAAAQPSSDPQAEIRGVLAAYANAVQSQNVDNIRRLYPGMTAAQQRGWEQFFESVRDVKAQLSVAQLDVSNGTAEAQVTGTYTYLNGSTRETERQPVAFHAVLRREAGTWHITQVR